MDLLNYFMIALVIFYFILRFYPTKGVKDISTTVLRSELTDKDKQYIDVRTPSEFKSYNIRGFKNIPLQQLGEKASQLSKDKEVVVICQSGMRSKNACKILKKQGFKYITNVKGGMNAWKS